MPWTPGNFIQDNPRSDNFVVTMTKLRVKDSGFYWCGTYESSRVIILKTIHLVVSQGEFFPFFCVLLSSLNHKMLVLERTPKVISFNPLVAEHWGSLPKVTSWLRAEPPQNSELRTSGQSFLCQHTHFPEHFCCY